MTGFHRSTEIIGVLGGMGPAATADFYRKIVAATPATRDQDHLRTVIWSDPSIPDRAEAYLRGGESPVDALLAGARILESAGAGFLAVPCNTAHLFLAPVRKAVTIPVLNMIELAVLELSSAVAPGSSVAVLGTAATRKSGMYHSRLRQAGYVPLDPTAAEQHEVTVAIAAIKSGAEDVALRAIAPVIEALVARGARTVIAACTELPIVCAQLPGSPPVTDPTAALARFCVTRAGSLAIASPTL